MTYWTGSPALSTADQGLAGLRSNNTGHRAKSRVVRTGVAFGLAVLAAMGITFGVPTTAEAAEVREITLPIQADRIDDVYWSDTYGAPRSGGRSHIGVDIMGPKMVPLVAAADGVVTWFRHDASRGNNLEITDADGWKYHYIHINNDTPGTDDGANLLVHAFAPGIERGATVKAGQVVAYLGDSGNAESTAPHLHFEIERPDGVAINPTQSVDAARERAHSFPDLSGKLGPFESADSFFDELFTTLTGREGGEAEQLAIAKGIEEDGVFAAVEPFVDSDSVAADIDRLYVAFFLRLPDIEGYEYWIERQTDGLDLVRIADHFAGSQEYKERYDGLDFGQFLDQLYRDVLGRAPDVEGRDYWLDRLADPNDAVTKGTIVAYFTDSAEMRAIAEHRNEIVALTALFTDRMPSDSEIEQWETLRRNQSFEDAAISLFLD